MTGRCYDPPPAEMALPFSPKLRLAPLWPAAAALLLTAVLALAPVAAGGMLLGVWLHTRVGDRLFYTACYLFVLLTGLKLGYDGLRGLSG